MNKFLLICFLMVIFFNNLNSQQRVIIKNSTDSVATYDFIEIDSIEIKKNITPEVVILSIEPKETIARIGDTIQIIGKGFGISRLSLALFNEIKAKDIILWNDSLIIAVVPYGASSGDVVILRDGEYRSNGIYLEIYKILSVKTTISGRITNIANAPMSGATVTCHDSTAITDENGLFSFPNITVPTERCFVNCKKDGYFDASRATIPNADNITEIRMTMQELANTQEINSTIENKVIFNDSASISFKGNGFMNLDGSDYNGKVKVSSKLIKISDSTFNDFFPGDITAENQDGSNSQLISYGFFAIDLKSESNEPVELKTSVPAEISFNIYEGMETTADSIPGWYFDYNKGMWVEDGYFIKSGNKYIAQATHFSNFNCDCRNPEPPQPPYTPEIPQAKIVVKVVSCNDYEILTGVKVNVGQQQVTTDNSGNITVSVVGNQDQLITVTRPLSSDTLQLTVAPGDSTFATMMVMNAPVIKGRIENYNNQPYNNAVYAKWGTDGFASCYAKDGKFSISVATNKTIFLHIGNVIETVTPLAPCETKNLSVIEVLDSIIPNSICDNPDISIGNHIWMGCNLNVDTYRNGDPIPEVTDPVQWKNLKTGAWCYYNNDPANGVIYGKLYNWYAVNDPRGLAPEGWHEPSEAEWRELENYLGDWVTSGGKLKSTGTIEGGDGLWHSPNKGATNEISFSALPGGNRGEVGQFSQIGEYGYWWTATENNRDSIWAYLKSLQYDTVVYGGGILKKLSGYSVRCIRDK